jgi:hypothetical protein
LIEPLQRPPKGVGSHGPPRGILKECAAKAFKPRDPRAASGARFEMRGDHKRRTGAERTGRVTQQALVARVTLKRHI